MPLLFVGVVIQLAYWFKRAVSGIVVDGRQRGHYSECLKASKKQ